MLRLVSQLPLPNKRINFHLNFRVSFRFCISLHIELHGPPMLVVKTNFGSVLYNHAWSNFYRFEKHLVSDQFFCFSLVNQRHTSAVKVYNRKVTNIENTVRAVHSCNSRLLDGNNYI